MVEIFVRARVLILLTVLLDVLDELVRLARDDLPFGVQALVLRSVASMVSMLDEHFLVHTAVHRPILKLLKICVGDELVESLDTGNRAMGAASSSERSKPSQYEEDREYHVGTN